MKGIKLNESLHVGSSSQPTKQRQTDLSSPKVANKRSSVTKERRFWEKERGKKERKKEKKERERGKKERERKEQERKERGKEERGKKKREHFGKKT